MSESDTEFWRRIPPDHPGYRIWQKIRGEWQRDDSRAKEDCIANYQTQGQLESAVLILIERRFDTLGRLAAALVRDVADAEEVTLILSSATEFLLDFYAPWFREIERRFQIPASSLAGQSRLRLIGRTEHWKAEAFQHGLDGEKLGSIETEGASAVEPRGDESASPKEKAPTRLGGGKPKAKSGGRPSGTTVDSVRLRTYRAQYSQEDFADKCGVSLGTIQRGEAGRRWDEKTFVTVAKNITALGNKRVSPEDLKNRRN